LRTSALPRKRKQKHWADEHYGRDAQLKGRKVENSKKDKYEKGRRKTRAPASKRVGGFGSALGEGQKKTSPLFWLDAKTQRQAARRLEYEEKVKKKKSS